nr:unnamed protein product [Spirometra erinaceieuropaei]
MGRDLRVGVISPYSCHVFGDSRPEQSSSFSDVVALSATAPDPAARVILLILAVRNVRSILDNPGINPPERRTSLIAREPAHQKADIAVFDVTPLSEPGQLEKMGVKCILFWNDHLKEERHVFGVAFTIRVDSMGRLAFLSQGINNRLMTLCLPLKDSKLANIISVCAPRMTSIEEVIINLCECSKPSR